jgi:hypothetical protein
VSLLILTACGGGGGSDDQAIGAAPTPVSTPALSPAPEPVVNTPTPAPGTTTPSIDGSGASASLRMLTYSGPNDWFYRATVRSAADNTPDSNGLRRGYDLHVRSTNGVLSRWGFGGSPESEGVLHWNGAVWSGCPLGTRGTTSSPDAQGIAQYNYCDSYEVGTSQSTEKDIAGRTLSSVVNEIRASPGSDSGVAYRDYGPTDLAALGAATFPAGAKLSFQSMTSLVTSPAYNPTASATVLISNAAVAAGGDARQNSSLACGSIQSGTPQSQYTEQAATLEDLVGRNLGTPCIFNQVTSDLGNVRKTPVM